jgi:hypothetical protein
MKGNCSINPKIVAGIGIFQICFFVACTLGRDAQSKAVASELQDKAIGSEV